MPYELNGLKLGNAYATVDLFINRMEIGDFILVPDGDNIYFCEIPDNMTKTEAKRLSLYVESLYFTE